SLILIFTIFFLLIRPPPKSTLFPYTTLFRSQLTHFLLHIFQAEQTIAYQPAYKFSLVSHLAIPVRLNHRFIEVHLRVLWQVANRSEEHTSELQSPCNLVCRLLLEKKKNKRYTICLFNFTACARHNILQ